MEHLHPKAIWKFFFRTLFSPFWTILIFGIILGPAIASLIASAFNIGKAGGVFFLVLGLIVYLLLWIGGGYIWARLYYKSYKFELGKDAFQKERGVIWKKYISIPYERIQNVDIYRGIIDRILGLSEIMIQTAGYSGYSSKGRIFGGEAEAALLGLSKERAEEIRKELIKRAKGVKSGV